MSFGAAFSLLEQVVIRTAEWSDLPSLEWGGEYSHYRLLYKDVYKGVMRGEAIMWVAEYDCVGVIGQLFIQLISLRKELADGCRRAYLYGFRIQSDYRQQGIGSRMLDIAETDLLRRGFRWISLNVGRDNSSARRLYERHGYRVVAIEPGRWTYLDDRGYRRQVIEPAWRMEKDMLEPINVSVLLD